MLHKLLKKRWLLIVLGIILALSVVGVGIGRNTSSESVFAYVTADENGTEIEFFNAASAMIPYRFTCHMRDRTLQIDLRTSVFGDSVGSRFRLGIPASAYDELVIHCDGQLVNVTE